MRPVSLDKELLNTPVKVLLVDDDENAFILTRRLLNRIKSGKFETDWVPTYEAGLKAIEQNQHDVYLLDYRLGARTGLELLKEALQRGCTAPIIMLTTENPEVDVEAMRIGAADFLNKDNLDSTLLERSIRYSIKHFATLKALRKSEAQLASFMQNVPCAVYMKDLQGRFVYVNDTFAKLFRKEAKDFIGREDEGIWPRQIVRRLQETEAQIIREKKVVESTETLSHDQEDHYWLFTRFPILNEHGSPIMVGGAALDITERKRLEKEIQEVSEQEKRRIGQDLHDGLGQYLTGIACMAKVLEQKLASKKLPEANDVQKITNLVNQTIFQARDLARGLCPVELEMNGLHSALQQLAASVEKVFNIRCVLEVPQPVFVYDNAAAVHLYRIAQEAVNNAVKHGKAKQIVIRLTSQQGSTTLIVKDNGMGLPKGFAKNKGMGLRVMQYRAGMFGANVQIQSVPNGGTSVTCVFPNPEPVKATAAPATSLKARREAKRKEASISA